MGDGIHTVDDRNPACPYIDLIYQKTRNSGNNIYIYIYKHIYIYVYIR